MSLAVKMHYSMLRKVEGLKLWFGCLREYFVFHVPVRQVDLPGGAGIHLFEETESGACLL